MENSFIYGCITLAVGLLSTFFTIRMNRKSAMEQNVLTGDNNLITQYKELLDQVQEERSEKAKEMEGLRKRMDDMEERETQRIQKQAAQIAAVRRYVEQLHQDIYNQLPPPPRAVPDGLFD